MKMIKGKIRSQLSNEKLCTSQENPYVGPDLKWLHFNKILGLSMKGTANELHLI